MHSFFPSPLIAILDKEARESIEILSEYSYERIRLAALSAMSLSFLIMAFPKKNFIPLS